MPTRCEVFKVDEPTTKITIDIESQISRLIQLADMVKLELERSGTSIPVRAGICMTQLIGSLSRFGKQIRRHDEELKSMRALASVGQVVNSS